MPQPTAPIRPDAPEVSIITSSRGIPDVEAGPDTTAWSQGLNFRDDFCLPVHGWKECGDIDDPEYEKVEPDIQTPADFKPWTIYVPFKCRGFVDEAAAFASVMDSMRAKTPFAVARELWTGEYSDSMSLMSTAVDIGNGPIPALNAANALIANFQDATGGLKATLHVPSIVAGELESDGFAKRQGDRLVTAAGHVVVPGPGYPNTGAFGPADSSGDPVDAGDDAVWMMVSGPVEVALNTTWEERHNPENGPTFARQNLTKIMAERQAIFRFPPCAVFASQVLAGAGS